TPTPRGSRLPATTARICACVGVSPRSPDAAHCACRKTSATLDNPATTRCAGVVSMAGGVGVLGGTVPIVWTPKYVDQRARSPPRPDRRPPPTFGPPAGDARDERTSHTRHGP